MALGYGSEFHLLRWLGRHRKRFTDLVCQKRWRDIRWLDFNFADGKFIPDSELLGISFLNDADKQKVEKEFVNGDYKWPKVKQTSLMNWDVVGIANDGTYILGEAKAHIEEISRDGTSASTQSRKTISDALRLPMTKVGSTAPVSKWLNTYYQLANRLYMLAILEECGLKAVLLNIFFTGDHFPGRRKVVCPQSEAEWRPTLDSEYATLGIDTDSEYFRSHIIELFLPVADKQR